jgi:3-methyladenine DNA glycosylase Mpg
MNGTDLTKGSLYIANDPGYRPRIKRAKRIGVDYAGEWKNKLLRFIDDKSKAFIRR